MILDSVALKNGHTVPLKSLNLVLGPNNSGKTSFLNDLTTLTDGGLILQATSPAGFNEAQVKAHMDSIGNYGVPAPTGGVWRKDTWDEAQPLVAQHIEHVGATFLKQHWPKTTMILDGKTRLSIVDDKPYSGIAGNASNVFETLRKNRELKAQLQKYVEIVLPGKFFALWNPTPTQLRAYICNVEPANDIEYFDSPDAAAFFDQNASPLASYSDGIKAFLGILINVIADGKHQFLIDEPEAFLHPHLCFKLGHTLAEIANHADNMCFCATHSPYFLKGCLSRSPNEVSVTRFEYENDVSKANTLATDDLISVIHDPLLNNIGVTEGLFHSRVVVTEGDSDRAFYTEINNRLIANGHSGIRDCVFVNAQNKQTIAKVLGLFRKVSIPCAAISDVDTFKEGGTNFSNILQSLSIAGATAESMSLLRDRVDQSLKTAALGVGEVATTFEQLTEELAAAQREGKTAREFIGALRGKTKPPDYKRLGGLELLENAELTDAQNLVDQLQAAGWFVLRSGEVENWLLHLNVGTSKHGWLLRVFDAMGADPTKRGYIVPPDPLDDVWLFISTVGNWFSSNLGNHDP